MRKLLPAATTLVVLSAAALLFAGDSRHEDRAFLGVHIEEETAHPEGGARVVGVVPGSPAERAGLREGDVVQSVDGRVVRGPQGLRERLEEFAPGDRVDLGVLRDDRVERLDVELADRGEMRRAYAGIAGAPEQWREWAERVAESGEDWAEWGEQWAEHGEQWGEWAEQFADEYADPEHWQGLTFGYSGWYRPRLGVQLVEPTPELREHLGGRGSAGVLVAKVLEDMPAEAAGIHVGDLIVAVNGAEIAETSDLARALHEHSGERISIDVIRDGRRMTLDATLPVEDEPSAEPRARLRFAPPAPRVVVPALPPVPAIAPPPVAVPAPPAPRDRGDSV